MMLRSSAVAMAFALTATVAHGQGCVLVTDSPPELRGAAFNIGKIADDGQSARNSEKPTHFRRTLTLLYEDPAMKKNEIGRNYLLGKLYAVWLTVNLPGTKTITTRNDPNLRLFGGDDKRVHDLYMSMDSALAKVEAENPACVDSTQKYRGAVSQMAYNEARAQLEAKNFDSAAVLARRALVADPRGAAPWNLLAEANNRRGDTVGYKVALRKVAESVTGNDPAMKRVKGQAYRNLAIMALADAQKASPDEQKRLAAQAESDLKELMKLEPNDPQALTALSRVYVLKGDTAAAKGMMDEMVKSPEKFSAAALFEAAGAQVSAGEFANANKLYEASLTKNALFRDGLFNYIVSLLKADEAEKALPVTRKLLSVDPNGAQTAHQVAAVWSALYAKANEADKAKIQDSLLAYTELRTKPTVSVRVVEFTPSATGAIFDAQINNNTDAAKSYDLEVEFLNATGGVVSTGKQTYANVAAKGAARQTITGTGAGIVAYRYKALK